MDFNFLDDVANSDKIESGAWMHVTNPATGLPWFVDANVPEPKKPVRILVRSIRSGAYQALDAVEQRAAFSRQRSSKRIEPGVAAAQLQNTIKARRAKEFVLLTMAFENVPGNPEGVIKPDPQELLELAPQPNIQWMIDQVFEFAREDANYGADSAGNVDAETSGKSKKAS